MTERWKNIMRGSFPANELQRGSTRVGAPLPGITTLDGETVQVRHSNGLEQFFGYIRDENGLAILDLAGATQANINFITSLGHKLYTEDFLRSLHSTFGTEGSGDQSNPGQIEFFLHQNLNYPDRHFDGVLVWDVLEHLGPALLSATLERLFHIVKPRSYLLAIFHAQDKALELPAYSFRIQDAKTLQVAERGTRKPVQLFNNRSLEKLFQRFESLKFFLTREHLREVIVKR